MGGICNFNTTSENAAINLEFIGTEIIKQDCENEVGHDQASDASQSKYLLRIEEADQKYHLLSSKKKSKSLVGTAELKELETQIHSIRNDLDTFSESIKMKYSSKIRELSNGVALLKL